MLTLLRQTAYDIIYSLLTDGRNYRPFVVDAISDSFLGSALSFLCAVARAKEKHGKDSDDWYKRYFLSSDKNKMDIATNAGMNLKTVTNIHQNSKKETVLREAGRHYDHIKRVIEELLDNATNESIKVDLTIEVDGKLVRLTTSEAMVVLSALAVKRASLRGSAWSMVGKRIEKPLMNTLCQIFEVPVSHRQTKSKSGATSHRRVEREVDYFLVGDREVRCEVKLMGRGNPESADATFARRSNVFIADKLSATNRQQLDENGVLWVELHSGRRFEQFYNVLTQLGVPHGRDVSQVNSEVVKEAIDRALVNF